MISADEILRARSLVVDDQAANVRLPDDRQDVGERHVLVVRALVVAPAHVHAHALAPNVDQRPIDRRDAALDEAPRVIGPAEAGPYGRLAVRGGRL